MSILCQVGMRDIIWQQHGSEVVNSYHAGERNTKLTGGHYAADQPEQIHFNVVSSGGHVNAVRETQQHINSFIKNNISVKSAEAATTSQPNSTDIHSYLLNGGKSGVVGGKWSVAIDDNQNPQVSFKLTVTSIF